MIVYTVLIALLIARFVKATTGTACDRGFTLYSGNHFCYRLYSNPLNYNDATKFCQEHGAELASIHSVSENAFISSFSSIDTLIGLRYSESANAYQWSDGSSVDYESYASDFESGNDSFGYCAVQHGEEWQNADCDIDAVKFVCQKQAANYTATNECPQDINYTNGGMFVSPGYPKEVAGGLRCQYKLLARDGYFIKIFLDELNITGGYMVITRESDDERVFDVFPTETRGYEIVLPTNKASVNVLEGTSGTWRFSWLEVKEENAAVPPEKMLEPISSASTETMFCNLGYRLYEGKCYRNFNDVKLNFYDAFARCRSTGGNLVTIHDPRTDALLQSLVGDGQVFIGLRYVNGTLQWLDGSPLDYTNYADEFLTTQETFGYCTQIKDEQWHHVDCTNRLNFICESNATSQTPTANNICPEKTLIYRDYGVLFSPGYPQSVSGSLPSCFYQLSVKEGNFIRLFIDELEVSVCWFLDCYYDTEQTTRYSAIQAMYTASTGTELIIPHNRFLLDSYESKGRWKISFEGIERS